MDNSFPNAQFKIEGYESSRKDRDAFGGGLFFSVNEKLNCRSLESFLPSTIIEILLLEIRLLNSKWLILRTCKSPSQNEPTYVSEIQKLLIVKSFQKFCHVQLDLDILFVKLTAQIGYCI